MTTNPALAPLQFLAGAWDMELSGAEFLRSWPGFLRALGAEPAQIPLGEEERAAQFRNLTTAKPAPRVAAPPPQLSTDRDATQSHASRRSGQGDPAG